MKEREERVEFERGRRSLEGVSRECGGRFYVVALAGLHLSTIRFKACLEGSYGKKKISLVSKDPVTPPHLERSKQLSFQPQSPDYNLSDLGLLSTIILSTSITRSLCQLKGDSRRECERVFEGGFLLLERERFTWYSKGVDKEEVHVSSKSFCGCGIKCNGVVADVIGLGDSDSGGGKKGYDLGVSSVVKEIGSNGDLTKFKLAKELRSLGPIKNIPRGRIFDGGKSIDEAQLILDYLYGLSEIGHVKHKRKKNIALEYLVTYILEKKYNLVHPDQEFEEPLYCNDGSFRAIFKEKSSKTHVISDTEEEPEVAPAPANESNYQDLVQRFERLETHFDQRFDQIETHLQQHATQYQHDMNFMRDQMNDISTNVLMMSTYFNIFGAAPHPPLPDQGPSQ
ncbi:hypothetical protein MA16_Dca002469 [Dendrobium catenatum]|uniref:Uncharacterized protein n=1 Tax=Dendrobium catenatum TaxID=906689 RepID=A0A2I0W0M1_9ASPA|nr:hypothetical protein MA16_Dca002469 [Dendrobium catenatum]